MGHFPRGAVFSMKDCLRKHIAHAWAAVNKRDLMFLEILRSEEDKLHDNVSGQTVFSDAPLEIGRATSSRCVLMLPWIEAPPNGEYSAVLLSDEIQAVSLSGCKKNSKTSP